MAFLLMFVTVLHLVTLAMLFIATMEKVSRDAKDILLIVTTIKKHLSTEQMHMSSEVMHVYLSKYIQNCRLNSFIK